MKIYTVYIESTNNLHEDVYSLKTVSINMYSLYKDRSSIYIKTQCIDCLYNIYTVYIKIFTVYISKHST